MYFKIIIKIEVHTYNAIVLKSFDFKSRAAPSMTRNATNQQSLIIYIYIPHNDINIHIYIYIV